MKDAAFSRETRVMQVNGWLDKASSIQANERLLEGLKRRFEKNQDSILQTVEARSRDRLKNLETTLEIEDRQNNVDDQSISQVFSEPLRSSIGQIADKVERQR
jgi:hypothetical protein